MDFLRTPIAGTATVTRALAERINKTAAPQDVVTGNALRERVRQREGLNESIMADRNNSQDQEQCYP